MGMQWGYHGSTIIIGDITCCNHNQPFSGGSGWNIRSQVIHEFPRGLGSSFCSILHSWLCEPTWLQGSFTEFTKHRTQRPKLHLASLLRTFIFFHATMITSVAKDLIHRQRHAVLDQLQISQIYLMQPVTQGLMQQGGAATLSIGDGTSCFQELYSRREIVGSHSVSDP